MNKTREQAKEKMNRLLQDLGKTPISIMGNGQFIRWNQTIANYDVLVLIEALREALGEAQVALIYAEKEADDFRKAYNAEMKDDGRKDLGNKTLVDLVEETREKKEPRKDEAGVYLSEV